MAYPGTLVGPGAALLATDFPKAVVDARRRWILSVRAVEAGASVYAILLATVCVLVGAIQVPHLRIGLWVFWKPLLLWAWMCPYVSDFFHHSKEVGSSSYVVAHSAAWIRGRGYVLICLSLLDAAASFVFMGLTLNTLVNDCGGTGNECDRQTLLYSLATALQALMGVLSLAIAWSLVRGTVHRVGVRIDADSLQLIPHDAPSTPPASSSVTAASATAHQRRPPLVRNRPPSPPRYRENQPLDTFLIFPSPTHGGREQSATS